LFVCLFVCLFGGWLVGCFGFLFVCCWFITETPRMHLYAENNKTLRQKALPPATHRVLGAAGQKLRDLAPLVAAFH
jgi:hypothetical protein